MALCPPLNTASQPSRGKRLAFAQLGPGWLGLTPELISLPEVSRSTGITEAGVGPWDFSILLLHVCVLPEF